jgi:hypothetical protein
MTEQEWLESGDLGAMLRCLGDGASGRKFRLFAVGRCRPIWHLLTHEQSRRAVEVVERYADGRATRRELRRARKEAWSAWRAAFSASPEAYATTFSAATCASDKASVYTTQGGLQGGPLRRTTPDCLAQADLLRDIFGNPFRTVTPDPARLTPQVVALAQATYDQREQPAGTLDLARLAVLADALADAGCTDAIILNHCRQSAVRVRGCWAADLLLGKS